MQIQLPWMSLGNEGMHLRPMPSYCSGHVDNTADGEQKERHLALPVPQDSFSWADYIYGQPWTYGVFTGSVVLESENILSFKMAKGIFQTASRKVPSDTSLSLWTAPIELAVTSTHLGHLWNQTCHQESMSGHLPLAIHLH